MKIITNLICTVLTIIIFYLAWANFNNISEFSILQNSLDSIQLPTSSILLLAFIVGSVCGAFCALRYVYKGKDTIKAYERKLEKTAISNDTGSAKIKVLESKIQVLEKALDDALNNK